MKDAWENVNGSASQAEVISLGEDWLKVGVKEGLDNAHNRAAINSKQAGGAIKNGAIEATISPTDIRGNVRFGLQFRYVDQQDVSWLGYDSSGWYIQRKGMSKGGGNYATGRKNKDLMPDVGGEVTVRVEFRDNLVSAAVGGQEIFKDIDISTSNKKVPITAGGIGFMLGKFSGTESMYVKDIMIENFDDSSTTQDYDWKKDSFEPVKDTQVRGTSEIVRRGGANWYELSATGSNARKKTVVSAEKESEKSGEAVTGSPSNALSEEEPSVGELLSLPEPGDLTVFGLMRGSGKMMIAGDPEQIFCIASSPIGNFGVTLAGADGSTAASGESLENKKENSAVSDESTSGEKESSAAEESSAASDESTSGEKESSAAEETSAASDESTSGEKESSAAEESSAASDESTSGEKESSAAEETSAASDESTSGEKESSAAEEEVTTDGSPSNASPSEPDIDYASASNSLKKEQEPVLLAEVSNANAVVVTKSAAVKVKDGSVETWMTLVNDATDMGIVLRYNTIDSCVMVGCDRDGWYWQRGVNRTYSQAAGLTIPGVGETVHIVLEYVGDTLTLSVDDVTAFDHLSLGNEFKNLRAGNVGFYVMPGGHCKVHDYISESFDITVPEDPPVIVAAPYDLKTDLMTVTIDQEFPRVIGYEFKDGRTMIGQPKAINALKINQRLFELTVDDTECVIGAGDTSATYTLTFDNADHSLTGTVKAILSVKDNIVSFDITEVTADSGTVYTIEIPDMNMISVTNQDTDANFTGARMSGDTQKKGDYSLNISKDFTTGSPNYKEQAYIYGFVSNSQFSAGLWSNSEANNDLRVTTTPGAAKNDAGEAYTYLGLRSSVWTIQNEAMSKPQETMPSMKVIITADENDTNTINWQDGAIAYREIMNNPLGNEQIPDMVAQRVVENFASQAAHPFLETLDGVKRVSLATDGLGQQILLKGFASEGHDSAHPDYGAIGSRIGGVDEMKYLLDEGAAYGARFGVHINASEAYPEAKAFDEKLVRKSDFGWNWVDESYLMNIDYDLDSGKRQERLQELYDQVGNSLDFIYLDVWSNSTWATRQISKQFNDFGWRCANEWGYINEYDCTWNHWATDLSYGGADKKGINSDVMRFIRNHQKDSWIGNYPAYKGTAVNPLLGGEDVTGFEGWQREKNFDDYMEVTYGTNIPTKFLQHYLVMEWENDPGKDPVQTNTEKYIRLQDEAKENTVEINRKPENGLRTITFNGVKILEDETYLIPWYWNTDGEKTEQKLYHWNPAGGETTWQLPAGWEGVGQVLVYRLSDAGKTDERVVDVTSGQITLNAAPKTAYVIYPSDASVNMPSYEDMKWGEGTHLEDPNFSSLTLNAWDITGNEDDSAAVIHAKLNGNALLQVKDNAKEVALSQTISGLESGASYMALVAVENKSDRAAHIEVTTSGLARDHSIVSNYTRRSQVKNYVGVNSYNTENAQSYMQNMPVVFTVPEGDDHAELTLRVEAGQGTVWFDELRVVKTEAENWVDDHTFVQDFEHVAQGLYPFVVGNYLNRPADIKMHLSEKNEPYTQIGWNDRIVDDVIDGQWSLKAHQLTNANGVIYQTIPQTFRFLPGRSYKVSFDYECGYDNTYGFIVGTGEHKQGDNTTFPITNFSKATKAARFETTVVGSSDGDTWIGIYSNPASVSNFPYDSNSKAKEWKMGSADIILDNLKIECLDAPTMGTALDGTAPAEVNLGEDLDLSKLFIKTVYADGMAVYKDVTPGMTSGYDKNLTGSDALGEKTIKVTDQGKEIGTFKVKVNDVIVGIEATAPSKTSYVTGVDSKLDLTDGKVELLMRSQVGQTAVPLAEEMVTVSDAVWSTPGTYPVDVTYMGYTKKAAWTVTSKNPAQPENPQQAIKDSIDRLNGLENKTPEEQKQLVKNVVDTVTSVKVTDTDELDLEFFDSLEVLETAMAQVYGGQIGEVIIETDADLQQTAPKVTGALLNIPLDGQKKTITIDFKKGDVKQEELPVKGISMDGALIADITMYSGATPIQPKLPLLFTMKIPEALKGKTLVAIHYHGAGRSVIPVIDHGDGTMSIPTGSLSNFVIAEQTGRVEFQPQGASSQSDSQESDSTVRGRWIKNQTGWWYQYSNQLYPSNQWSLIDESWYHFDERGYMQTGWIRLNGKWYYLNSQGRMAADTWVEDKDSWYYVGKDGVMLENQWIFYKDNWYYLTGGNGSMAKNTVTPDGYTVGSDGARSK